MDEKQRFVLLLPAGSRRQLDELATESGLSRSDIVRMALSKFFGNHDWLPAADDRRAA